MAKILITGGAGFVGSHLAECFRDDDSTHEITVLDNLKRRGSELNLSIFKNLGIEFHHGDIRHLSDLQSLNKQFDWMIEASAEPSVLAGMDGSPAYLLESNLIGTLNCLEFVRQNVGRMVFLSTSRVYAMKALREIALTEAETRFELKDNQIIQGVSRT